MWTPHRVFILVVSFVGLLVAYYGYGLVLGRYSGMRPLPPEHYPNAEPNDTVGGHETFESSIVRQLRVAFGPTCKEAHRPIQLELKNQGVVIAASYWRLLDNGNLGFDQVSVAIFGKPTPDGRPGEINTIRGIRAEIRFDQPLRTLRDVNDKSRKAVGGRLEGGYDKEVKQDVPVHLRNNRRTSDADDDLHLYTDWLEFLDDQHRIWTEARVELVEGVRPNATVVTAKGMEVLLVPGDPPAAGQPAKRQKPTVSGVRSVRLESTVRMDLLIDNSSTFLSAGGVAPAPEKPAAEKKAERGRLVIHSQGPFLYTIGTDTDTAQFSDSVEVLRPHGPMPAEDDQDELKCDQLTLLFKHRNADDKRRLDERNGSLDLVRAHAVGKPLELSSQAKNGNGKPPESLQARGTTLIYEKEANRTTLEGQPIEAVKDGHQLRLKGSLVLTNLQKGSNAPQDVHAIGPGEARLRGKDGSPNIIARWNDEFRSSKDGDLDRIVLLGKASFEDPERGKLHGETLVVKLGVVPGDEQAGDKKRRLPKLLEATESVSLVSPQLVIAKADRLRLEFVDAAAKAGPPVGFFAGFAGRVQAPPTPAFLPANEAASKPPIVLTARIVEAKLLRDGGRTELDQLDTEGAVRVTQDAGSAIDRGTGKPVATNKEIRIEGERLKLVRAAKGYKLRVSGRGQPSQVQTYQPAYVQMDKLRLLGPTVEIDQPDNVVYVNGPGSMKMPSKTDFQGNQLEKVADVTIDWTERMLFDGRNAQFYGGVIAVQDISSLAAQELHVELEQTVSLKERNPGQGDQPATLRRIMGYGKVCLEKKLKVDGKWKEFQRIEGSQLLFEKLTSVLQVSGPGYAYMLQPGGKAGAEMPAKPPAAGPAAPANSGEPKLTRIEFTKQMKASKADDRITDTVEFSGKIHLVTIPTDQPDTPIDEDKLPNGSIALRCNSLKGWSRKAAGKPASNDFLASGQIEVLAKEAKGQEFKAQADQATYDEAKDLLILESTKAATIWRQQQPGGEAERVSAKKIWYWRKENKIRTDQTTDIGVKP